MAGRNDRVKKLDHDDVLRIYFAGGSILATSRANPIKHSADLGRVVASLKALGIGYLVTIRGDDTIGRAISVSR